GQNVNPLFLFINTFNGGSISTASMVASITGDMSTGAVSSGIQNQTGGSIQNGGSFGLSVGGNLTTTAGSDLSLFIDNFDSGLIGSGAALTLNVTGNLNVGNGTF